MGCGYRLLLFAAGPPLPGHNEIAEVLLPQPVLLSIYSNKNKTGQTQKGQKVQANQLSQELKKIVSGDLSELTDNFERKLKEALIKNLPLPTLTLAKHGVLKVIDGLQRGKFPPALVQKWASFMKRGYIDLSLSNPVSPIEIEYDQESEEEIVEVLSRLDEIGDSIDGEVEPEEIEKWTMLLSEEQR